MLYEFHHKQNTKKAGSVHATYLITGTQRPSLTNGVHNPEDGADNTVSSSLPLPSSSMPGPDGEDEVEDVPRKSMLLVREEHLAEAREKFEHITGIHIYSLQAKGLSDFQALTECNRQIAANYASEDPLQAWKQYGTIKNAHVRRRTGRAAIPPAATPAPTVKHGDVNIKSEALTKTTPASSNPASEMTPAKTERVTAAKPKSDIFKSFAKTQPPKPEEAGKDKSRSQSTAKTDEDVPMGGFSDDDDDDEDAQSEPWADGATSSKVPAGKSKTEREAELKAMMERDDDDDDAMEDVASPEENDIKDEETEGAIDKPAVQPEPESQDTTTVENGRRRGRRRVIKKKTVKDEEGYLGMCVHRRQYDLRLTLRSDKGRSSMGVLLRRRRTRAEENEDAPILRQNIIPERRQAGPGKHHVVFQQEMRLRLPSFPFG